jgi:hypothetical protein
MHDRNDELTAAERERFESLPREMMPSRLLEERIVSELRARGHLGEEQPVRRPTWRRSWNPFPLAAAAAAGVALFASGLAVGQWLGARHTAETMLALQRQDSANAAAAIQRTGSAYLSALGAVAQASASSDPKEVARARVAAQNILHEAANEMVRLAPDDPVSAHILQGFDKVQPASIKGTVPPSSDGKKSLVWF